MAILLSIVLLRLWYIGKSYIIIIIIKYCLALEIIIVYVSFFIVASVCLAINLNRWTIRAEIRYECLKGSPPIFLIY